MLKTDLIPAEVKDSRRLMIMLHGLGDSIEGYRWVPEAFDLPWLNYLLVNAPDEYYGGFFLVDLSRGILPGGGRRRGVCVDPPVRPPATGVSPGQNLFF